MLPGDPRGPKSIQIRTQVIDGAGERGLASVGARQARGCQTEHDPDETVRHACQTSDEHSPVTTVGVQTGATRVYPDGPGTDDVGINITNFRGNRGNA